MDQFCDKPKQRGFSTGFPRIRPAPTFFFTSGKEDELGSFVLALIIQCFYRNSLALPKKLTYLKPFMGKVLIREKLLRGTKKSRYRANMEGLDPRLHISVKRIIIRQSVITCENVKLSH